MRAARESHASVVVLGLRSGHVLASSGDSRRATPGSTIKPLLLQYALEHGIVQPQTEVYCRRDLHVGGRALPCTHPPDRVVFTAQSALAESCNTWFARMAARFSDAQLQGALDETHLPHTSMREADTEARQLATLGLRGVSASPIELARAYQALLARLPETGPVARGLRGSVQYGMAHPAAVPGLAILGKTGTASNPGEAWTHGWFVGALPGRLLLVVYVPRGDGGTAARLAQVYFSRIQSEQAR